MLEKYTGRKTLPALECRVQYFRSAKTPSRIDLIKADFREHAGRAVGGDYKQARGISGKMTTIEQTDGGAGGFGSWNCAWILLRNFPKEGNSLRCVFHVACNIRVHHFVDLVAQHLLNFFTPVEPDRCEVVDLHCPDFLVP